MKRIVFSVLALVGLVLTGCQQEVRLLNNSQIVELTGSIPSSVQPGDTIMVHWDGSGYSYEEIPFLMGNSLELKLTRGWVLKARVLN